jgi:putative cell wall-binding protein
VLTTAPVGYQRECGTSFAAPTVAGVLALAESAYPQASGDDLATALYASAANVLGANAAHGRVDAAALLATLGTTFGTARAPERIAGSSRVATAVALSQHVRSTATSVVVARADNYADALAAAPLAGKLGAPVLLTPSSGLDPEVAAEVARLGATTAVLVGGTGALGPAVEAGLRSSGITDVQRLAGASRYETAASIALEVGGTSVLATDASGWPDAVAASSLAALTRSPIVLVDRDGLPAASRDALAALGATSITVIGGSGVVSDATVAALSATGASVSRLAGATRYETSRAIADAAVAAGADPTRAWVATGTDWPDALAAGPAAAADGGVLLLVDGQRGTGVSGVSGWLRGASSASSPAKVLIVGGPASVSEAVAQQLASLS